MKKIFFTILMLAAFLSGYTQMNNNGGYITVESGATLVIEGDYTSTSSGTIEIDGDVVLKGDFVNNSGSIAAGSTGDLVFNGAGAQEITGTQSTTFYCGVEIDNAAGVALTSTQTGNHQTLANALTLTNGKLTLNTFDLTLSSLGVSGFNASNYIVTNSTGKLKAPVGSSNFVLPVGSATAYNPVVLNEAGTADVFGVVYTASAPAGWSPADHAVTGRWDVTEAVAGGNNLSVTPGWNAADEQASFDNTDCAVGVTTDNGATIAWKASGTSTGPDANGTYARIGTGFNGVGTFVVGDYWYEGIELDLDMFLAGAYSGGSMSTALNGILPTTDPYGNGITGATIPGTAVDWIEVELRSTPATVDKSYSFFVDNAGNVLNTDGALGAKLTGLAKGSYYVAVKHRNHLGAMTASAIDFSAAGPFAHNFTTGTGVYGTNAMQNISGTYALWAGDANADGQVIYQGAGNDPTPIGNEVSGDPGNTGSSFTYIVNGYSDNDINLDGQVIYQGANNDPTMIGNAVSGHPGNTGSSFTYAITQQIP
jgi:hypothetical protein